MKIVPEGVRAEGKRNCNIFCWGEGVDEEEGALMVEDRK